MEKKIKHINIRISLQDYESLKYNYFWNKEFYKGRYKSFSDYIRDLLDLGIT